MRVMLRRFLAGLLSMMVVTAAAEAATKVHVIAFGKWTSVQWYANPGDQEPITLKVRALVIDGRVKEYVLGAPHDVTERLFVVRRVFRVNDSLPADSAPRW